MLDSMQNQNLTPKNMMIHLCIWADVPQEVNVMFTSEEYIEADENFQETDALCTE
jgi:hypothetical protein